MQTTLIDFNKRDHNSPTKDQYNKVWILDIQYDIIILSSVHLREKAEFQVGAFKFCKVLQLFCEPETVSTTGSGSFPFLSYQRSRSPPRPLQHPPKHGLGHTSHRSRGCMIQITKFANQVLMKYFVSDITDDVTSNMKIHFIMGYSALVYKTFAKSI